MSYRRAQAGGVTITTATVKKMMAALSMERALAVAGAFSQENAAITNLLRGTIRSHSSRRWKTFPMKAACSPNRYGTDLICRTQGSNVGGQPARHCRFAD